MKLCKPVRCRSRTRILPAWVCVPACWVAGLILVGAPPASAAVFYSGGGALEMTRSPDEVIIELDGIRDPAAVSTDLAAAGFPSQEIISSAPDRFRYRRLYLDATDPEVLATVRAVDGITAVRHTYRPVGSTYAVIPTGTLVAKFQPGTPADVAVGIAAEYDASIVRPIEGLPQAYILKPDNEADQDAFAVAASLYVDSRIVYSHPSYLMKDLLEYTQVEIDDPLFPFQWHLHNTGQLEGGTPDADIDALEAWEITQGFGAVVGINDSAVHWEHEDLVDNYLIGHDYRDNDGDPSPAQPFSLEGHGTSAVGLIAARGNTVGLRGVAPLCQFTACRYGADFDITDEAVAASFLFHERAGAMAISNSWSINSGVELPTIPTVDLGLPDVISDAIDEVATNGRSGRGVLVLFSSGNDSILVGFGNIYAAMPNTMAIGATLRNDLLTCYSNFGPEQSVVAPGGGSSLPRSQYGGLEIWDECFEPDMATVDIDELTLTLPGVLGFNPPTRLVGGVEVPDPEIVDFPQTGYTSRFNGTSAACPVATGVAALVFSVNPNLTAEQARNLIEHTADKIQAPNEAFDVVTGHNVRYGHGRVNALRAVEAAVAGHNWPSPVEDVLRVSSQDLVRIWWTNPENDVAAVLIARSATGQLDWTPTDGIEYTVGQQVAPGVIIVANSLIERLDQTGLSAGQFDYALFVRNASHYYAWGRRIGFESTGTTSVPLASLSASPKAGQAPLSVHFAGGAIDPSGLKSLQFAWDFGDGSSAAGATADHVYTISGEYTVRLTVTNTLGQSAEATTRIVVSPEANLPPQAIIAASPTSGDAPLVVIFEGGGTDLDGNVVRYVWNFGDGFTAIGQVVEHTYITPGTHGATLTVTDDKGGTGIASVLIKVTGPGTTAAQTVPTDLLDAPPECATGLPVAAIGTVIGMFGLITLRRRR